MGQVKSTRRRVYGGRTGAERATARRDALVEAGFALVAEHGWRVLSIDSVCRRAGLNKRYFYESFDGLDALIGELTNRLADDAIRVTLAQLDPELPRDEATGRAITAFIEHLTDDPRRVRVLFGAVPAADAAAGHRAAAIRRLINTVATRGRSIYDLRDGSEADLTAAMLIGGTSQALLDWLDGRVACTRAELVERIVVLWLAIGDVASSHVARPSRSAASARGTAPAKPCARSAAGTRPEI
jgi:AcrR family transcriptional regulator